MLQEWCILGVGKGVLFREVSSVQGCGCIGVPSCENSEANSVLMLSDSLPHALNIHTYSIMIEEMFYKMADRKHHLRKL